jgi:hypothetical protein
MKASIILILSSILLFSCGKKNSNSSSSKQNEELRTSYPANDPLPFRASILGSVGLAFAGQEVRLNSKSHLAMICEDNGATNGQRVVELKKYLSKAVKLHQARDTAWYMGGCSIEQPGSCRLYHPYEVEFIIKRAINNLEKSILDSKYCPSWTVAYTWRDTQTDSAKITSIYKSYYPSENYKTNYCIKEDGSDFSVMVAIDNINPKLNSYFSQFQNDEFCADSLSWIVTPAQKQHYTSKTFISYGCYRDTRSISDFFLMEELKQELTDKTLELKLVGKYENKESCVNSAIRM